MYTAVDGAQERWAGCGAGEGGADLEHVTTGRRQEICYTEWDLERGVLKRQFQVICCMDGL